MSDLKSIRQHLSLTQDQMAKAVGVSRSYYANIERGRYRLNSEHLINLVKLVGENAVLQSLMNEMKKVG
jgi:DNA-binding XRE family transcriptional regulator